MSHLDHIRANSSNDQAVANSTQLSIKNLTLKINETVSVTPSAMPTDVPTPNPSRLMQPCEYAALLETLPFSHTTKAYIIASQKLNFSASPRKNYLCPSMPPIQVHKSQSLPAGMKWFIICTYERYTRGMESNLTYKNRLVLMKSIIRMVSYHNGYSKPAVSEKTVAKYLVCYREATRTGVNVANIFKLVSTNTKLTYIENLQQKYPKFLHSLFCFACKVLGSNTTVPQIVECMNSQACICHPHCPDRGQLQMTIYKFWNFFYSNGGKLKQSTERPSLTAKNKLERLKFAKKWSRMLRSAQRYYITFLDEKWFYPHSCRKKMKVLPKAPFEIDDESKCPTPKTPSRCHPTKVMFLGVISPLILLKILMEKL